MAYDDMTRYCEYQHLNNIGRARVEYRFDKLDADHDCEHAVQEGARIIKISVDGEHAVNFIKEKKNENNDSENHYRNLKQMKNLEYCAGNFVVHKKTSETDSCIFVRVNLLFNTDRVKKYAPKQCKAHVRACSRAYSFRD